MMWTTGENAESNILGVVLADMSHNHFKTETYLKCQELRYITHDSKFGIKAPSQQI